MMIEVKNLSFSYGKRKQKIFDDFSLTLGKGSVYGLLGKNGTGKSTLLYLMTGLLRPRAGQIFYKGMNVSMLPSANIKRYVPCTGRIHTTTGQLETIFETEHPVLSEFQP